MAPPVTLNRDSAGFPLRSPRRLTCRRTEKAPKPGTPALDGPSPWPRGTGWEPEQLISCWTLDEADWQLLANKRDATRLGFMLIPLDGAACPPRGGPDGRGWRLQPDRTRRPHCQTWAHRRCRMAGCPDALERARERAAQTTAPAPARSTPTSSHDPPRPLDAPARPACAARHRPSRRNRQPQPHTRSTPRPPTDLRGRHGRASLASSHATLPLRHALQVATLAVHAEGWFRRFAHLWVQGPGEN